MNKAQHQRVTFTHKLQHSQEQPLKPWLCANVKLQISGFHFYTMSEKSV